MAMTFEEAMKELETVVKKLDRGEATLEESIGLFERGIKLADFCHRMLDIAEDKVGKIAFQDGRELMEDFPPDDDMK